jgi:hypothetical protein
MSENPAIHRHPSGDVDIALPHDDPDTPTVRGDDASDETCTTVRHGARDSGTGNPPGGCAAVRARGNRADDPREKGRVARSR